MNYIRHLNAFFSYVKTDTRLTSAHVSLYMALFQHWNENRFKNPIKVQREKLMQLGKIRSKNSYYRCIKELHQAGYIFCHLRKSQFHQVNISLVKLGQAEEKSTQQLSVFEEEKIAQFSARKEAENTPQKEEDPCLKNGTATVLKLGQYCLNLRTATVLKLGHLYKQNIYKTENSVCNTPTKIIEKNMKILNAIKGFAAPPKNGMILPSFPCHPERPVPLLAGSEGPHLPDLLQVQEFFTQSNYPVTEARKFYYYNHSKGWILTGKVPIKDWQSLAHKWMLNQNPKPNPAIAPNHQNNNDKDYSEPL